MSDGDMRLGRLERVQERLIKAVVDLTGVGATTNALVNKLIEWMQQEPEGPRQIDVILELVKMVMEVQAALADMRLELAKVVAATDAGS